MQRLIIKKVVGLILGLGYIGGFFPAALADNQAVKNAPAGKVVEISVAVNDVHKSTQQYAKVLGLSQWQYIDLSLRGGDNSAATRPQLRVARAQWQDVTVELIQPLADASPVREFIKTRGEGLYAVGIASSDIPETLSRASQVLFRADSAQGGYATWWDTFDSLGINVKAIDPRQHKSWGKTQLPTDAPVADRVFQLGIVVEDIETTAKHYQRLVGLAPWMVVDFQAPHVSNAQYLGAMSDDSSDTVIQVGYGNWSGLQIELLAPITGPSPHRDFLITTGAGAHHLSFGAVAEHDEWVQGYREHGLSVQMQSDNGGAGRTATYMATEQALGFVLELTRKVEGPGSLRPSGVIGLPAKSAVTR
ncbi:MAG: VOC family protein [Cellvibrionaceae bacterium]